MCTDQAILWASKKDFCHLERSYLLLDRFQSHITIGDGLVRL